MTPSAILLSSLSLPRALAEVPAVWDARPWARCTHYAGDVRVKVRRVRCLGAFNRQLLPDIDCGPVRPAEVLACACGSRLCDSATDQAAPQISQGAVAEEGLAGAASSMSFIGCLPAPLTFDGDDACRTCDGQLPCNQGLPFFSLRTGDSAEAECLDFCLSKGLDIAGFWSAGASCRCGLSAASVATLMLGEAPALRQCLRLPRESLLSSPSECPVRVFLFVRPLEAGRVPFGLQRPLARDMEYVSSVVLGRALTPLLEEDSTLAVLAEATSGPGWQRQCWPESCGIYNVPFLKRISSPPEDVPDLFDSYILIRYAFEPGTSEDRMNGVYEAVTFYLQATCIVFQEVAHLNDPTNWDVLFGVSDSEQCFVAGMGRPSKESAYNFVNLGWCNSPAHAGNIAHEIGHVVGMHHEQVRMDAQETYYGQGPYLKLHWDLIESDWKGQWEPTTNAYVGSAFDGEGDPHVGYAPYDFESIMHYSVQEPHETIPPGQQTGNRGFLTAGDKRQLNDMYQCHLKFSMTTTTDPSDPRVTTFLGDFSMVVDDVEEIRQHENASKAMRTALACCIHECRIVQKEMVTILSVQAMGRRLLTQADFTSVAVNYRLDIPVGVIEGYSLTAEGIGAFYVLGLAKRLSMELKLANMSVEIREFTVNYPVDANATGQAVTQTTSSPAKNSSLQAVLNEAPWWAIATSTVVVFFLIIWLCVSFVLGLRLICKLAKRMSGEELTPVIPIHVRSSDGQVISSASFRSQPSRVLAATGSFVPVDRQFISSASFQSQPSCVSAVPGSVAPLGALDD